MDKRLKHVDANVCNLPVILWTTVTTDDPGGESHPPGLPLGLSATSQREPFLIEEVPLMRY